MNHQPHATTVLPFALSFLCFSVGFGPYCSYLQGVFGADGQHLVFEVAELAAPGASLADPADETGLMGAAHRTVTAAWTQQLPLMDTRSQKHEFFFSFLLFNPFFFIFALIIVDVERHVC